MKKPNENAELIKLCGKVRDDELSPEDSARLEQILLSSPAAMEFYRQFIDICSGLEQLGRIHATTEGDDSHDELTHGDGMFDWADQLSHLAGKSAAPKGEQVDEQVHASLASRGKVSGNRGWRLVAGAVAIAATAAAAMFAILLVTDNGDSDKPVTVAAVTFVDSHQAVWAASNPPMEGGGMETGSYALSSGAALLRYASGVELLVQAPVSFSIDSEQQAGLINGSLSTYVPAEATGFRVETPWATVVDHGTRIGIFADAEDGLEVHVFEGKAETVGRTFVGSQMLDAGDAVSFEPGSENVNRIGLRQDYFAASLDQLTDLPVVSGDVELLVSPPRSVRRLNTDFRDLERATVFAERSGVLLSDDIKASFVEPGKYEDFKFGRTVIPAGTKVDSFMMHIAMPQKLRRTDEVLIVTGELMFSRPIVGVIAFKPAKFGALFGHAATDYPRDRDTGLESSADDQIEDGDWLRMSEDREKLQFRLRVHGRDASEQEDFVDQIRVLIESAKQSD